MVTSVKERETIIGEMRKTDTSWNGGRRRLFLRSGRCFYHFRRILVHFLTLLMIWKTVCSLRILKIVSLDSEFFSGWKSSCFIQKYSLIRRESRLPREHSCLVLRQNEWRRRAALRSTPLSSSQLSSPFHSDPRRSRGETLFFSSTHFAAKPGRVGIGASRFPGQPVTVLG